MQTLSVDQLVGQTLGNYRVERLLGQGRLNAVYLARNLFEQRTDALTLYLVPERFSLEARQRFLVRFLKEAAAISTLKHPHILPVCEYNERGGFPYLVTPYMTNGSLADVVKQQGACSHTEVLDVLEQVGAGLEYAHSRGHIHGMLRPSNIVLGSDGTWLVAGFGLMHMLQMSGIDQSSRPYAHLLSVVETFMIAPEYVAPEIVQGQAIDKRSDVYALGAVLFELLSGRPPFTGEGTIEVALQHVNQPAPSLRSVAPEVPVALASVINQALEREPDRRFQRVSELVEAFAQVSKGVTGELRNTTGSLRTSSSRGTIGEQQTGSWQLLPPIVTGKLGSIPSSATTTNLGDRTRTSGLTGGLPRQNMPAARQVQKSPAVEDEATVQIVPPPAQVAPAPPRMRAAQAQSAPAHVPQEPQVAAPEPAKPEPARPEPAKQESVLNGMKPFDWWSMPGQFQEIPSAPGAAREASSTRGAAPNAPKEAAPARAAETARPQATVRLNDTSVVGDPWGMEPIMPSSPRQMTRSRSRRRSGGLQRRQVVVAILAGGVLAAGGATVFALAHATNTPQATTTARSTNPTVPASKSSTTTKTTTTTTKPTTPANKPTTTASHTGTVVAKSNIPLNSAVDFTNPATGRADILVHLPNGQFVAYDRACTHQQILINYDPNTHMMVCPLHGSIFDPANNGKVVQGPAVTAVASVPIRINGDGTITTA